MAEAELDHIEHHGLEEIGELATVPDYGTSGGSVDPTAAPPTDGAEAAVAIAAMVADTMEAVGPASEEPLPSGSGAMNLFMEACLLFRTEGIRVTDDDP